MTNFYGKLVSITVASTFVWTTSCSDYELMDANGMKQQDKIDEYSTNFVARYGTPDPNHDFGMGAQLQPIVRNSGTRASGSANGVTENNVCVRRNMWVLGFAQNGTYDQWQDEVLGREIQIPGWPNDDNLYYTSNGDQRLTNICYFGDKPAGAGSQVTALTNSSQPVGDVTDYEIQYVSTWFRTHKNIKSLPLHLSDFFIQNISIDNDQKEYRGAVDCQGTVVDANSPYNSLPITVGANGENIRRAKEVTDATTGAKIAPWSVTRKAVNSDEEINYSLDWLHFCSMEGDKDNVGPGWTHVNDFNRQNAIFNPEEGITETYRTIKYVTSSGTESFACRASMDTSGDAWVKDYVLVQLTWTEVMADGQEHERTGFYLGFDYSMEKAETKVECDGFYSNWIVKITPGYFSPDIPESKALRVMCEDLGSTFDFDFNDVIYDVALESNNGQTDAIISLQAAGGTLPVWVGTEAMKGDPAYEAHALLGSDNLQPINVIENGPAKAAAIYRIKNVPATTKISDINLYVEQNGVIQTVSGVNSGLGGNGNLSAEEYGQRYKGTNSAPRRFAVAVSTQWMQECKFIETNYSKFPEWVQDKTKTFIDKARHTVQWYEINDDIDELYTAHN